MHSEQRNKAPGLPEASRKPFTAFAPVEQGGCIALDAAEC